MKILTYTIPPEDEGRPVKRVIRGRLGISHRQFSAAKAAGEMRLDGQSVHATHPVRAGQTLTVALIDERRDVAPEEAPLHIVYEDEDLLVIDKPAPLACQCSHKQETGTLENRLAYRYPGSVFRPLNRLDKGTSGLMVCAKHAHAQMVLTRQLHTPDFVREYLAIVCGAPPEKAGEIDAPIGKAEGATVRREVRSDGREAATRYEVVETGNGLSLIRLVLKTGRTHQIRVHMRHVGCPVYGDYLYGVEQSGALPGRFALHAHRVEFVHPMNQERLAFTSPLPPELQAVWDAQAGDRN